MIAVNEPHLGRLVKARQPDGSKSLALQADFLGLDVEELKRLDQPARAERIRQAFLARKQGTDGSAD